VSIDACIQSACFLEAIARQSDKLHPQSSFDDLCSRNAPALREGNIPPVTVTTVGWGMTSVRGDFLNPRIGSVEVRSADSQENRSKPLCRLPFCQTLAILLAETLRTKSTLSPSLVRRSVSTTVSTRHTPRHSMPEWEVGWDLPDGHEYQEPLSLLDSLLWNGSTSCGESRSTAN